MSSRVTIVMYHYVRNVNRTPFPGIKARSVEEFENQILYFKKYYNIISIETLLSAIYDTDTLPLNPVLLTFDDGYLDHYTNVFPILKKHNISGCFYPSGKAIDENIVLDVNKIHFILASVNNLSVLIFDIFRLLDKYRKEYELKSNKHYYDNLNKPNKYDTGDIIFIKRLLQRELDRDLRERIIDILFTKYVTCDEKDLSEQLYMNRNHLAEMVNNSMHIGSHGYDHFWLNTIDRDEQEKDIEKSLKFLMSLDIKSQNWSMCYPYGAYNQYTLELLKQYECKIGFIVKDEAADINQVDSLLLPRYDTNSFPVAAQ